MGPENPEVPVEEDETVYKVEYYYDNEIDTTRTEVIDAKVGDIINKADVEEKAEINKLEGYKLTTILNVPLEVVENVDNNVIKVHYKKTVRPENPDLPVGPDNPEIPVEDDSTIYKVEYFYDNEIDTSRTEVVDSKLGDRVSRADISENIVVNTLEGYKLFTVLNVPLKVKGNVEENVIKVHYKKQEMKPTNPDLPVGPENPEVPVETEFI